MEDAIEQMIYTLKDRFPVDGNVYDFPGGVQVGLRPALVGGAIYIMRIRTAYADRDDGSASDALGQICEIADDNGVTLFLEVEPFDSDGLDTNQLLEWYRKFGFRGDASEMIREPTDQY